MFVPLPEVAPPDAAALAVNLAFNNPGLTTIEPISLGEAEESGSRSSPAGNPEEQGLPGDLTAELAAAANLQVGGPVLKKLKEKFVFACSRDSCPGAEHASSLPNPFLPTCLLLPLLLKSRRGSSIVSILFVPPPPFSCWWAGYGLPSATEALIVLALEPYLPLLLEARSVL